MLAYLASQARQLADSDSKNVITRVIGEQQMKELGTHSYLAVGQGSQNESLMSVIEYKGNASEDARPIVLVGKGLTFDSGGISIKPSEGMDEDEVRYVRGGGLRRDAYGRGATTAD